MPIKEDGGDTVSEIRRMIDIQQGMEYALGNIDFFRETLEIYLEETSKNLSLMDRYLKEKDLRNYAILVHSMKSSSRLVGAVFVKEFMVKMEEKCMECDLSYVNDNHPEMITLLLSTHKAIHEYLGQQC